MAEKKNEVLKENEVAEEAKKDKISFKDKLLNFKFLSILIMCAGILSVISAALFLVFFQLARMYMGGDGSEPAVVDDQIIGFIMFLVAVGTVVMGIINAYTSYPFIVNRDKLSPKKSHGWMSLALGILDLAVAIFGLINLLLRPASPAVYWIVVMILGVISACSSAILLFPALNVKLYQPKPVVKDK